MKRFLFLLVLFNVFCTLLSAQESYDLEAVITTEPQRNGTWLHTIRDEAGELTKLNFVIDNYNWTFLITSIKEDYCGCMIYQGHREQAEDDRLMEIEFKNSAPCICEESRSKPFKVKLFMETEDEEDMNDKSNRIAIETIEYVAHFLPPQ